MHTHSQCHDGEYHPENTQGQGESSPPQCIKGQVVALHQLVMKSSWQTSELQWWLT